MKPKCENTAGWVYVMDVIAMRSLGNLESVWEENVRGVWSYLSSDYYRLRRIVLGLFPLQRLRSGVG